MRVHLDYVGCRLNQAEIERMARQFAARGDTLAADASGANLVVINTCAVTTDAARKSRQMVLQAGRANPDARIVATGCAAEFDPASLRAMPGVERVISNADKDHLVEQVAPADMPLYDREPIARDPLPPGTLGRTRAFVKVQDGCDNRCTFCLTTLLRGEGRSRPSAEVVGEIEALVAAGYREVVLTGVHLGSYGHDLGDPRGLSHLVETILAGTSVPRLRLSSLEPWDLDADFFALWSDPRLCPHLHLPLQSGSDAVLRRMARRTSRQGFAGLVESARARIPGLAITSDVIVGFPAETGAEFAETLAFVQEIGFARLHVFGYSRRPGTPAARMSGHLPQSLIDERRAALTALSGRLWRDYQTAHLGRRVEVLWESAHGATPEGFVWSGHTGSDLRVFTTSPLLLHNTVTTVRLSALTPRGLEAVSDPVP